MKILVFGPRDRYDARLTSEQNERFLRMYEQSGMKNKADFICHRIFG